MASGMVIRPVILSPSFSAFKSWSSWTDSAVGLNESCAAAGCPSTNSSANAAQIALSIEALLAMVLRVESEPGICTTPFRFSVSRARRGKARRKFASAGRGIAIGCLPAPHSRTITALHHAFLVDLCNDGAIAREQRLGGAHLGADRELALGETVGAVLGVFGGRGVCLRSARAVGALVHLAAGAEVSDFGILRCPKRTCVETVATPDAEIL